MKTLIAILITLIAIVATPLAAQKTEVGVWTHAQLNKDGGRFVDGEDVTAQFDNGGSFGLSVSHLFGSRVSGELAVFRSSSGANVKEGGATIADLGDIKLTQLTAMARYHFMPGRNVDLYVAGGLAHVRAEDLDSDDLQSFGLAPVRIDSGTVGTIGAGVVFYVTPRIGIALDARYVPFEISARANGDDETIGLDLDPLLIGTGLKIRF